MAVSVLDAPNRNCDLMSTQCSIILKRQKREKDVLKCQNAICDLFIICFTLCMCILCVMCATPYESGLFIRFSDNKTGEKCVERIKCNVRQIRLKRQQKISVKCQNLDFSEAMAAILENGGHIFSLNPHLFIFFKLV